MGIQFSYSPIEKKQRERGVSEEWYDEEGEGGRTTRTEENSSNKCRSHWKKERRDGSELATKK